MRILVSTKDGHFNAAHPADRNRVMTLIKEISDGSYYCDIINDNGISVKEDLSEYCCKDWNSLIDEFIGRGHLEYVHLNTNIPKGCICSPKN
jgi:hypothetical protein